MPSPSVAREKPDDHADAPEIERRPGRMSPAAAPEPKQSAPDPMRGAEGGKPPPPPQRKRSRVPLIVLAIFIIVGGAVGGEYWWTTRNLESTDDAYTDGHAVTVAPQVAGLAQKLAVTDNQFVHAGDLLVQIGPRDFQAARDQAAGALAVAEAQLANAEQVYEKAKVEYPAQLQSAQANVESAQANLTNAEAEYRRQHGISRAATTQQSIDDATAKLRQAQAQVDQSKAQLTQAQLVENNIAQAAAQVKQWQGQVRQSKAELDHAELNLSYTHVLAPQDGWVTQRRVEQGDYLQVGGALLALVSPHVWVTANFKETQLDRMKPGQKVAITIDAYPNLKLTGHVDSIQSGSGSRFTAFPAENATGNYVKIVQRVPVKIEIDSGLDPKAWLPLGLSVEVAVTVE